MKNETIEDFGSDENIKKRDNEINIFVEETIERQPSSEHTPVIMASNKTNLPEPNWDTDKLRAMVTMLRQEKEVSAGMS